MPQSKSDYRKRMVRQVVNSMNDWRNQMGSEFGVNLIATSFQLIDSVLSSLPMTQIVMPDNSVAVETEGKCVIDVVGTPIDVMDFDQGATLPFAETAMPITP